MANIRMGQFRSCGYMGSDAFREYDYDQCVESEEEVAASSGAPSSGVPLLWLTVLSELCSTGWSSSCCMLAHTSFGLAEVLQTPYGLLIFGRQLQSTQTRMHMCEYGLHICTMSWITVYTYPICCLCNHVVFLPSLTCNVLAHEMRKVSQRLDSAGCESCCAKLS